MSFVITIISPLFLHIALAVLIHINSFAGSLQQVVTPNVNTVRAMEGSGESNTLMANVTVALPTYNPDVHSWFQQVETIFLMLRIKSQRIKVANLMQKLPPDVISRITDALADLSEKTPYVYLKDVILKRTSTPANDITHSS